MALRSPLWLNILVLNHYSNLFLGLLSIFVSRRNLIITSTVVKTQIYISLIMFTKECGIILIYLTLCVLDYFSHFFLFLLLEVLSLTNILGPRCWLDQHILFTTGVLLDRLRIITILLRSEFPGNSHNRITSQPDFGTLLLLGFD